MSSCLVVIRSSSLLLSSAALSLISRSSLLAAQTSSFLYTEAIGYGVIQGLDTGHSDQGHSFVHRSLPWMVTKNSIHRHAQVCPSNAQ